MATKQSPISRQPTKLDYSSPTQFRFSINQLPKVEYFTVAANVPGITLSETSLANPLKDIPLPGDKLTYEDLTITFIVDENLENYVELHNWLTGLGFPKDRSQFREFRSSTSNTPSGRASKQGSDIGDVKAAAPDSGMFSDATLTILTNKNNPVTEIRFRDCFPVSVGALSYNQNLTDIDYLTTEVTFKYNIYEIVAL
jgi:hypothetical protein